MSNLTEGTVLDDLVKGEGEVNLRSRDKETLLSGQNLTIGSVVGKVLFTIPTSGTLGSGTNGTCTSVTGGTKTQKGTYTATCTTANSISVAGIFRIEAPDGAVLGDLSVTAGTSGTGAFTDPQINLTINYDTGYNSIGDYFNIAVTDGSLKMTEVSWTAVDGSQKAAGILIDDYDASSADADCVCIVRNPAIVTKSFLRYRVDYTSGGTTTPVAGDTLTGLTTTTTSCRIVSVTLSSGTWAGGTAAGYFIVDQLTADFAAENVEINDSGTNDATVALTNVTQAFIDLEAQGIVFREEA